MTSNLSAFPYFQEREEATPAAFNTKLSIISANIAAVGSQATISPPSGNTVSISTNLEVVGGAHFQHLSIGSTPPSYVTTAAVTIEVNSAYSDYLYLVDSSAQKSSYIIGSRAGNLADGLNIWDASAGTMIASFSKQSIRFFQNVVGPVFDLGGALTGTYNAATFGTGSQSTESRIQAAINQASIDGIERVYIPSSFYPYSASSMSFVYTVQMVREGGNWDVYDVQAYGADAHGAQSATSAFQASLNATTNNKGAMYISTGVYRCGNINDSSSARVAIYSTSGATIQSTDSIWLRVRPTSGAKTGVTLRDLSFGPPLSGNTWGSPMILLHGDAGVGGIIQVDINNIKFQMLNAACDGLHLRACFEGRVANIWGYPSNLSSRLILYTAENFNSGNFQFDTIEASAPVAIQLNRAYDSGGNNQLLNQIVINNLKVVQSSGQASSKYVTTTKITAAGSSTLSLSAADVTSINTGDWVICADPYLAGDVFRINSKMSSTMVQLSGTIPSAITSGITLAVGNFGLVVLGNTRGVQVNSPHFESVGYGCIASGAQQIQLWNPMFGAGCQHGVVCKDGAQNVKAWYPTYSQSLTTRILMEVFNENLANVNNNNNALIGPAGFAGGGGPGSFLSDANADGANNVYWSNPDTTIRALMGSATAPSLSFKSEISLGWYNSGASTMALSYGTLQLPSDLSGTGGRLLYRTGTSDQTITNAHRLLNVPSSVNANQIGLNLHSVAAAVGGGNCLALSMQNSGGAHLEYARLQAIIQNATAASERCDLNIYTVQGGTLTQVGQFNQFGQLAMVVGTATAPAYAYSTETQLGLYRSGVSTMAPSYGTLNLATNSVRLSMRTLAASAVTASAAKTNVAVNEVVFTIGGASGASLIIYSGGTAYGFNSAFSAAVA